MRRRHTAFRLFIIPCAGITSAEWLAFRPRLRTVALCLISLFATAVTDSQIAADDLSAFRCLDTPGETNSTRHQTVSLSDCIQAALLNNRELQIERLNPPIARAWLSAAYGYYDPLFLADTRVESAADSGGFDPADFSRDAIYSADSQAARLGLSGFLPGGLSYSLNGTYAHSYGFRNGLNFDSYSLFAGASVRQPLLKNFWTDQGRMTIRVNKNNLKITELGVVFLTMDVINRTAQAYYELLLANEELRVREELVETRRQFLNGVQRKIEMGTLTVLDEQLAQAQVATAESGSNIARNGMALAENTLKTLLGDSWTNTVDIRLRPTDPLLAVPQAFDLMESWKRGLAHRADLAQLKQNVEKSEIDVKYRRNQLFPSLDLVAGYGRKGAGTEQLLPPLEASASLSSAFDQVRDGVAPNEMVGVLFSIPLGRSMERANYRASKQLREQTRLRVKQQEELVMREISDALHTARASLEHVSLTRRAREFSEKALAAEERKLAGGKSTVFFVLQLQGDFASAKSAELRAKADYNRAVSQLAFVEANTLERSNISMEIK